jgi:hypothetical protein
MKTAVVAVVATLGCASAFVAPSSFAGNAVQHVAKSSSAMSMSFEDATGVTGPLGFWVSVASSIPAASRITSLQAAPCGCCACARLRLCDLLS